MRQNLAVAYQTYLQIYSHKDNELNYNTSTGKYGRYASWKNSACSQTS